MIPTSGRATWSTSKYLDVGFKAGGAGLDNTSEAEGAGLEGVMKGVAEGRQEQGQGSEGTDTEGEGTGRWSGNSYLLADPRLVEAHEDGTVVHPTGAARSAPGTPPGPKHPYSQSLTGEGQGGRKRVASETGGNTSSSRSDNSVKANLERTSTKVGSNDTGDDFHQAETKAATKVRTKTETVGGNFHKAGNKAGSRSKGSGDDFGSHRQTGTKAGNESEGIAFRQVPLAAASQVNFQSQQGLHQMKTLFFSQTNSSGIFGDLQQARTKAGDYKTETISAGDFETKTIVTGDFNQDGNRTGNTQAGDGRTGTIEDGRTQLQAATDKAK
jgi:hypothetical protein